jgi:hypothetical protein
VHLRPDPIFSIWHGSGSCCIKIKRLVTVTYYLLLTTYYYLLLISYSMRHTLMLVLSSYFRPIGDRICEEFKRACQINPIMR